MKEKYKTAQGDWKRRGRNKSYKIIQNDQIQKSGQEEEEREKERINRKAVTGAEK